MSGATRFFLLLSTAPLPRLRLHFPRPSFLRFPHRQNLSPATRRRHSLAHPLRASQQFHTQTSNEHLGTSSPPHPWPHWSQLLNNLSAAGYFHRQGIGWEDELLSIEDLPDGFVRAANACLAFARERPDILGKLPRRDIEVVVENGSPFLFRNAEESVNRIRSFLCSEDSKVSVSDEGYMVDLMRFLLSYASSPIISSEKKSLYNIELVESSVQNLLNELVMLSCSAPEPHKNQFLDEYGQMAKPLGESIEMKRGDWICPRCTFMNFARNAECRECQECRPKRQLTGGEWTCPQCDYYNHRKNLVCLRCDCKPQGRVSLGHTNSRSALGNNADVGSTRFAANEKEANRWLSKVSKLDGASDQTNSIVDEGFPEIMPLRKGVNRFVVSTRKTPLERRLTDAQHIKNLDSHGFAQGSDHQSEGANNSTAISGQSTGVNSTSIPYRPTGGSDYVPFVPLPADRFAKKIERPEMKEENEEAMMDGLRSVDTNSTEQMSALSGVKDTDRPGDSIQLSEKPVNQTESKDNGQGVAEKSERWFRRIAEVHNVDDLATAVPDGDFPEVMPMRKGENRFVVSNKKDRSLTSPMYKRRMAMEQTNSDHYVPFVPLPADYFAKKDKPQVDGPDRTDKGTSETSSLSAQDKLSDRPDEYRSTTINDNVKEVEKQPTSTRSKKTEAYYGEQTIGNRTGTSIDPQTGLKGSWSSGYQRKENAKETKDTSGTENQISRGEWRGKSLEGSAVKETDPLDMSEEAKAERWFRRVAQIKDISELSQIPDEDFPSIMPMRKGVNRFVVSKRKTPLERRLTSPQYRKNLPIVSSDPPNKENEGT